MSALLPPPKHFLPSLHTFLFYFLLLPFGRIGFFDFLLALISVPFQTKRHRADRRKRNEEAVRVLAEFYDDDLPDENAGLLDDNKRRSSGEGNINGDQELVLTASTSNLRNSRSAPKFRNRKTFADLNSETDIEVDPETLTFPELHDASSLFPVRVPQMTTFVVTNWRKKALKFKFSLPLDEEHLVTQLWPGEGTIPGGGEVTINLKVELLMTTSVYRYIRLELEGVGTYYLPIMLTGEVSRYLDSDEIETFLPPIGRGAFGTVYKGRYRGSEVAVKVVSLVNNAGRGEFEKYVLIYLLFFYLFLFIINN